MSETIIEERPTTRKAKSDEWSERIAAQQRSGLSVQRFCRARAYAILLRRLAQTAPEERTGTFALAERGGARPAMTAEAALELVLATGERLRISAGVDSATLRTVLEALRA